LRARPLRAQREMDGDCQDEEPASDRQPATDARRHPAAGVAGGEREGEVPGGGGGADAGGERDGGARPSSDSAAATAANEAIVRGFAAVIARKRA
jgi:hypothetical protein